MRGNVVISRPDGVDIVRYSYSHIIVRSKGSRGEAWIYRTREYKVQVCAKGLRRYYLSRAIQMYLSAGMYFPRTHAITQVCHRMVVYEGEHSILLCKTS